MFSFILTFQNTVPLPRPSPSEKVSTSSAAPPPTVSRNLKPNRNLTSKSNTMGGLATRRGVQQPQQLQLYNTQLHFATMGHPRAGNSNAKVPPCAKGTETKEHGFVRGQFVIHVTSADFVFYHSSTSTSRSTCSSSGVKNVAQKLPCLQLLYWAQIG